MDKPKVLIPGAVAVDEIYHKRNLEPQEKQTKMDEVLRGLNKIDALKEEIKAFVDEKKSDIKQIALGMSETRKMLLEGYEGQNRMCFLMPDQTAGVMNFVDCENPEEVLWTRPLFPNERQLYISNAPANTGTEG